MFIPPGTRNIIYSLSDMNKDFTENLVKCFGENVFLCVKSKLKFYYICKQLYVYEYNITVEGAWSMFISEDSFFTELKGVNLESK